MSGQTRDGVVVAVGKSGGGVAVGVRVMASPGGDAEGAEGMQAANQTAVATRLAKMTKRTDTLASIMADIFLSELSIIISQILS